MSIMPSTNLEQALPELLQQRTAAEEAVQAAQRQVLSAQQRLVEVNRAIAQLLKKAGILVSDSAPAAPAVPPLSARAGRFQLVWKTADGKPSAQGSPDAGAPVVIGGRPVTFGNRQGKLAPTDVYRNAIGDQIGCLALLDGATGQVVRTSIIWGQPRGKQD